MIGGVALIDHGNINNGCCISDGLYMIEVDRVLRPGGYWVLSGPPVNWERHFKGWKRTPEDLSSEQSAIEAIAKSLCWTKVQQMGDIAVWQKPINHVSCKASRNELGGLGFCNSNQDPDAGWYACLSPENDPNMIPFE